jgi:heme A synthase
VSYLTWLHAALLRMIRTGAQAAIGIIGASAVVSEVAWDLVVSGTCLAMILSFLMSLTGLPETTEDGPLQRSPEG